VSASTVEGRGEPPSPDRSVASLNVCHPALPELVPLFRHAASDFAVEHGASPELRTDIVLAVSEAVTNAVKHSDAHEEETVTMAATASDGWLEIVVRDRGTGFGTAESDGLGLGLPIIARLSARLTISQEGDGTELRMGFPLPRD
jgi:anti-sigma regulatory factor (Ser/Thr protein kinase)